MPHFDIVASPVLRVTRAHPEGTPEQIDMAQSRPLLAKNYNNSNIKSPIIAYLGMIDAQADRLSSP